MGQNNQNSQNASRRDFVKNSSGVVSAAALATSLGIAPRAHAAADSSIKIGLVGCGGRGTGAAVNALSVNPNVKITAMGDLFMHAIEKSHKAMSFENPKQLAVTKDNMHAGFDAYKKVIDSGVDLVVLATSPAFRPVHFEYAVEKGVNCFMEKPVAVDIAGCLKVLELAKKAEEKNLKVGVGLQRHHHPGYIETIKRLHDGEIGDINVMRCYWNQGGAWLKTRKKLMETQPNLTELEYQMQNWYYFTWLGGDHIVEQHIHNIDVCNWVMKGYPELCQGQGGRQVRKGEDYGMIYDHHMVEYCYDRKWMTGNRTISQSRQIERTWNQVGEFAHGTKGFCMINGFVIYDENGKRKWRFDSRGWTRKNKKSAINPYQLEHDNLNRAIEKNEKFNEAENGARSTIAGVMGRMSTYSGDLISHSKALESNQSLMPDIDKITWESQPPVLPGEDGIYPCAEPGVTEVV